MKFMIAIILSLMPGPATAAASAPGCRAGSPMTDAQLTPEGIGAYINQHRLNLDETICCLPESWRRNYVIAPHSISAQSSTPHSPRIILYPPIEHGRPPVGRALSFQIHRQEGTPPSQHTNSIEVMDEQNGQLRFSDISFTRPGNASQPATHPATVTPNAQRCLSCHASPSGGQGGTFPLFTHAPTWPNTFPQLYKPTVCPTQAETDRTERDRRTLLDAIRRQPRTAYGCLPGLQQSLQAQHVYTPDDANGWYGIGGGNKPPRQDGERPEEPPREEPGDDVPKHELVRRQLADFNAPNRLALMVEGFEQEMVRVYNRRLTERIRSSDVYERYKYAMVGALAGCFNPRRPELAAWFSPAELAAQTSRVQSNARAFRTDAVLGGNASRQSLERALTCSATQAAHHYQANCFPNQPNGQRCETAARAAGAIHDTLQAAQGATGAEAAYLRMIAQSNLDLRRNWLVIGEGDRSFEADHWGAFRYLVAASGSNMSTTAEWVEVFTGGRNHRMTQDLSEQLMQADPQLRSMSGRDNCERLKQASLRATEGSETIVPLARDSR